MKERIEKQVAELEAKHPDHFVGWDWFQLSWEEEFVFGIDPARLPRMVVALDAYEALIGIVAFECFDFTPEEIQAARDHFRFGDSVSLEDFQRFAKEYVGLTKRESAAFYAKHEFWLKRQGLITYPDEQPRSPTMNERMDDWEEAEEEETDDPWGCLFPGECCMPGEHMKSECHTPDDIEAFERQVQEDAFDAWWKAEGSRNNINRNAAMGVWTAAQNKNPRNP